MSIAVKRTPVLWTEDEYLDREERSEEKHELIDGQIYLMAGSSYEHSALCSAVIAALSRECARRECQVLTSDMRVRTASGRFYYPDVSVVCGKPALLPPAKGRRTATLLNPTLIVEVLSPSTEDEDRGEKFRHYRTIPSLTDYVLIAQDRIEVEHHARQSDGAWLMRELTSGQSLRLLGGEIPIGPLYRGVLSA